MVRHGGIGVGLVRHGGLGLRLDTVDFVRGRVRNDRLGIGLGYDPVD